MSEDLYKKEKKPYVESTESEGKTDEDASSEAWNKHLYRNESIICDMFHGQYKSTLICSCCKRISITFDPFLMATLPIPNVKFVTLSMFHIQYHMTPEYKNYKLEVKIRDSDRIADLRKRIQDTYGMEASSFIITWVLDNRVKCIYNNQQLVKEISERRNGGVTLLFQIPPALNPKLPPIE